MMPIAKGKPRAAIPQGLRFNVFRRDNFTCRYCGKQSPEVVLHLDHVKPVVDGGVDTEENFVTSCVDCNQGKASTKGVRPPACAPTKAPTLVGMFGHTFTENGGFEWQFIIERQVDDDHFAVMTFSWLTGMNYETAILKKSDLLGTRCKLYLSAEEMNNYYERHKRWERWDAVNKEARA